MNFFEFLNDKASHGLKVKIGMFLNKQDIWNEFIVEGQLAVDKVNSYDRTIISNAIFNKDKDYISKGTILEVSDEDILREIALYVDFILPRSCYTKLGNKKENYDGIKTVKGLTYFYDQNNDLDIKEYTGEDKISAYKKEYFKLNAPYQHLDDTALFYMLQNDVFDAGLHFKLEYQEPFNRFTMLKLLHHFYRKREFEDIDRYICTMDEYEKSLEDDLIDQYVIDKEVEVGDFVIHCSTKYVKEALYSDNTLGIGLVYDKHFENDEFKVDFKSAGLGEWFDREKLKVVDMTAKKEFIKYIEDVFFAEDYEDKKDDENIIITKEEKVFAGISLFKNKFIKVKSPVTLERYTKLINVHVFNENDNYCFVQDDKTNEEYLIDKKTNDVYEFDSRLHIDINEKQVAFIEDVLFNINRLEPMLKNYYNDYSVFFDSPKPSIKQLYLISKTLNDIYKKQLKGTKYKKFFKSFEPPFRQNTYRVKLDIPRSKVCFENYSYDEIKEIINFLKSFNYKNKEDMQRLKELFVLE